MEKWETMRPWWKFLLTSREFNVKLATAKGEDIPEKEI
jgi:hypothetical protein